MTMKLIPYTDRSYAAEVDAVVHRSNLDLLSQDDTVRRILRAVQTEGDEALLRYTRELDQNDASAETLKVRAEEIQAAYKQVKPSELDALKRARDNIRSYHRRQAQESWDYEQDGVMLGQRVRPLATAGIYVPGGKAAYPSSVLMNAVPAQVAGVETIVMCSPAPGGKTHAPSLVAADLAGVQEIYKIGGAQAVAAMAYGTATIPRVDKIVGPGNIYVALAKRMVFGIVDIDMIAGPSEILVLADETARPEYVAADLLSQAEHDEEAVPLLVTPSEALARRVQMELDHQKEKLNRRAIIEVSLERQGRLFVVESMEEAVALANRIAPEHLELAVAEPDRWLEALQNAGAIFLGHFTPEAVGDYFAGPNHVLPTSGTARFASPLGVYDFIKRTSVIRYSREALRRNGDPVMVLAGMEALEAHARAVKIRVD